MCSFKPSPFKDAISELPKDVIQPGKPGFVSTAI